LLACGAICSATNASFKTITLAFFDITQTSTIDYNYLIMIKLNCLAAQNISAKASI
jgi:hypothetical protein